MPIVFLTFVRLQPDTYTPRPFLDTLANYVITPALLIYTLILYLYFLTILVQGSLPRGGIAYLVFIFTLIAVGVKAYQPLLGKRLYDWFFNHFQWISLPALIMFWIGTGYRIHQYGYTQARIYLLLCGVIMTLTVLMFFSKKWGRYLYATLFAILLLAGFTYLPGITARDWGHSFPTGPHGPGHRIPSPLQAGGSSAAPQRPVIRRQPDRPEIRSPICQLRLPVQRK